jgi:hypothetical protein
MAFRTETTIGAILILFASAAHAASYQARHKHLHNGAKGTLVIAEDSISWEEGKHSRQWRYQDIQELVLSPDTLRIVTYTGQRWQMGRDEVFVFDKLAAALSGEWYPKFREKLDQRFVAALADERTAPDWQIPVKLLHGRAGSQGVLLVAKDRIVYKTDASGESRTWRVTDIQNVSSADPFDLTIAAHERDFRFQLKQALTEARYDELWRRVNQANGLKILSSVLP